MASVVADSDCHKDPNFAVICSFLDRYGELLALPNVSYANLEKYLEDTTNDGNVPNNLCYFFSSNLTVFDWLNAR